MSEHKTLSGEFVDLLPLTVEHARLSLQWRQSARAHNLNLGAQTVEQQAAWIAARPADEQNFVIALKTGTPVGMVSLCGIDAVNRHAESARFLIGDEDAVRGVPAAVEAMKLLYQRAFDDLGLVRVFGTISSDNTLMMKWQKFLGMREEGRMRQHYFINGHFQDAVMFGILAAEYRSQALPRMNSLIAAGRTRAASAASATE
jgi:RimJ/RimL family protein N-acetyltransferase